MIILEKSLFTIYKENCVDDYFVTAIDWTAPHNGGCVSLRSSTHKENLRLLCSFIFPSIYREGQLIYIFFPDYNQDRCRYCVIDFLYMTTQSICPPLN